MVLCALWQGARDTEVLLCSPGSKVSSDVVSLQLLMTLSSAARFIFIDACCLNQLFFFRKWPNRGVSDYAIPSIFIISAHQRRPIGLPLSLVKERQEKAGAVGRT